MDQQISKKSLTLLKFKTDNFVLDSEIAKKYCHDIFLPRELTTFFEYGNDGTTFVGKPKSNHDEYGQYKEYKKCIYQKKVLHSIEYTKTQTTDNTVILLKTGIFGQIVKIMNYEDECYLLLSILKVYDQKPFEGISHIEKVDLEAAQRVIKVKISEFSCKIMHLNFIKKRYLCRLVSEEEIQ